MSAKKAEQQGTTAVSTPVVSTPVVSTSWYQRHQTGAWLITTGLAVVAIVVTILIGLFGGVMPHLERESDLQIKNQVGDGLKEPLKKIGAMAEDIAEIKGELKILGPSLNKQLSEKMRDIARMNAKELASSLPRLSETVAAARKAKIAIEPRLVGEAGERVLEIAATQTEQAPAWDSVNEFLGYRSFLNSSLVPDTSNFTNIFSHPIDWQFDLEPHFYQYLWFSWEARSGKPVPADKAAVMERLDHHLNTDKKVGPAFLLIDVHGEASQTLDGFRIKNVIFRGVKILYKGGPVTMENVYFVNCEFQFIPTQKTRQLGRAILASVAVTFDSGKA